MSEKQGLFIVFEGIDGSGTSTQVHGLIKRIELFDKYQDVLRTHEPWKNKEIKRKLREDKDAYSDPEETAQLYVEDRVNHSYLLIRPNLIAGTMVISSRYKMSTYAFQWAQGVCLEKLLKMHQHKGILTPDITFFLDVEREIAAGRIKERKKLEKFERDAGFIDKVIKNYRKLTDISETYPNLFGKVIRINANPSIEKVEKEIYSVFLPHYRELKGLDFYYSDILKIGRQHKKMSVDEIIRNLSDIL